MFEGPGIRALLADGIRSTDFRIVRPDGEVRWISAQAVVEEGEDAEPIAVNGILQDVTERKNAEERRVGRLEQAANADRLTGLLNIRGFDLVAERIVAQAERAKHSIGLIFCDVDGLKTINDEFGHLEGDRVLQDVAGVLESTLRSADAIARVGGDEFAVLATGDEIENVAYLRDRLQSGFEHFNRTSERPYQLRVSCGAASCEPGVHCRLEELRAVADAQMYAEKRRRGGTR
jgi:diguanylate cyclase (GGDEF)-like protein